MVEVIDNNKQYIEIRPDFSATVIEGGDAFWSCTPEQLDAAHPWLMMIKYEYTRNWPAQEMHPDGDEIITVMEGAIEFILEPGPDEARIPVRAGATIIIPAGTWHSAAVTAKAVAQHLLMGRGTRHRSIGQ